MLYFGKEKFKKNPQYSHVYECRNYVNFFVFVESFFVKLEYFLYRKPCLFIVLYLEIIVMKWSHLEVAWTHRKPFVIFVCL